MVANVLLNLLLDTKNGFKLTSVPFRLYVRHCLVMQYQHFTYFKIRELTQSNR